MSSYGLGLLAAVLIPPIVLWQRARIIDVTCTGVFLLSQIVFVVVGVVASPWLLEGYMRRLFSFIKWERVTQEDLARTIVIVAGGTFIVILGSMSADAVAAILGRRRLAWGHLLKRPPAVAAGFSPLQLEFTYLLLVVFAVWSLGTKWDVLMTGLFSGYVGGDVAEQYSSRGSMQELGMAYYLIIFNALPFLTVTAWMLSRLRPSRTARLRARLMVAVTSVFLLATFEKRPFVLFLICLMIGHQLADIYAGRTAVHLRRSLPISPAYWLSHVPWQKLAVWVGVPFVILVGFYYLATNIAAESSSPLVTVTSLVEVTISRIFGRLAVMPILYLAYFPAIDPHYGLSNIGKWTDLAGEPYYADTVLVLRYFTGLDWGGGAIGAVVDFYGAFGWVGWATGCLGLGAALNGLDRWLQSLPPTLLNRALYLFMTIFAYYLSQASVARSLSSYGGGVFLAVWAFLRLRLVPRQAVPARPAPVAGR